ncbi:hypothetical protein KFE98_09095 [bacterium SCSIO 12741]|nr:hypothetical protein KFE98_09095 [bacterium SCSIO 12741]
MEVKAGTRINHDRYGEGIVSHSSLSSFTVMFKRGGELEFSRLTEEFEILDEEASENSAPVQLTLNDMTGLLKQVLEEHNGLLEPVEMGEKWDGGTLVLQPGDSSLKPKEIPIDTFFHKIVMVRDRLRVLEQQINSNSTLADSEKVQMQQYITRIYGSLTTFNVLFRDKDDFFKGTGK